MFQVDHADSDQRTALRAAAWGGHDDIVLKLLEYGSDVNKVDNEGRTALIAAAYMGHTEVSHLRTVTLWSDLQPLTCISVVLCTLFHTVTYCFLQLVL